VISPLLVTDHCDWKIRLTYVTRVDYIQNLFRHISVTLISFIGVPNPAGILYNTSFQKNLKVC
jgi:hypothetical protein